MTPANIAGDCAGRMILALLLVAGTGCATTEPESPVPCFRVGKAKKSCMTEKGPTAGQQSDARRFEASPQLLTIYVVRDRWADATHMVPIEVDGRPAQTLPQSFVRARVAAGRHLLRLSFGGTSHSIEVEGRAGEVVVVDLAGSVWSWSTSFRWEAAASAGVRERLQRARLTGDIAVEAGT